MIAFGGCNCNGAKGSSGKIFPVTPKGGYWIDVADTSWYKPNENSYKISTANQLAGLAKLVNVGLQTSKSSSGKTVFTTPIDFKGKIITLSNDISIADGKWTPIGMEAEYNRHQINSFSGTFDGNGHTISDMIISNDTRSAVGLFGYLSGSDAVIKNINLRNVNINTSGTRGGSIVGSNGGTVMNCKITNASINSTFYFMGGIAGDNGGTVKDCMFSGNISNKGNSTGGIVGGNGKNGTITDCVFSGHISGSSNDRASGYSLTGGIVGDNDGTVENCTSNGSVRNGGSNTHVGGIVGHNGGSVSNCTSSSNVVNTDKGNVGGIIGRNQNGTVKNCNSSGNVNGENGSNNGIGGIVGQNNYGVITNCSKLNGKVSTNSRSGGIIGMNIGSSISNNTYSKTATGQQWGIGSDYVDGRSNKGTKPIE